MVCILRSARLTKQRHTNRSEDHEQCKKYNHAIIKPKLSQILTMKNLKEKNNKYYYNKNHMIEAAHCT